MWEGFVGGECLDSSKLLLLFFFFFKVRGAQPKTTHLLSAEAIHAHTVCHSQWGPATWAVTRATHSHRCSSWMKAVAVGVGSTLPSRQILYPAGPSRLPRREQGPLGRAGAAWGSATAQPWLCWCCSCLCLQPWGSDSTRFTTCRKSWKTLR